MSFRAKYPSMCRACKESIKIGDLIVAEKGQKPAHADCDSGTPSRAAPASARTLVPSGKRVDCPDCLGLGWKHVQEKRHITRCDRCQRFDNDKAAALAHRTDCGCEWEARAGNRATRGTNGQITLEKGVHLNSKFAGKCKACGEEYGAGSSVVWYGKGGGTFHELCDQQKHYETKKVERAERAREEETW